MQDAQTKKRLGTHSRRTFLRHTTAASLAAVGSSPVPAAGVRARRAEQRRGTGGHRRQGARRHGDG